MSRFPTADHLASWAGLCPGNNESAGKHGNTRTRRGNREIRTALVEAAWAAARTSSSQSAPQVTAPAGLATTGTEHATRRVRQ
jgi:transposase